MRANSYLITFLMHIYYSPSNATTKHMEFRQNFTIQNINKTIWFQTLLAMRPRECRAVASAPFHHSKL